MDYEKKYNEALEKARQLCAYPTTKPFISDLQDLFQELAESEDEKIRKAIVNAIHNYAYRLEEKIPTEWLTWLEKQGEQKPAEPRFRFSIGDVIKSENEEPLTITKIDDKGYWSNDLFICGFEYSYKWELIGKLIDTPVWSEEDENMLNNCIAAIVHPDCFSYSFRDEAEVWLKSLKGRMQKGK